MVAENRELPQELLDLKQRIDQARRDMEAAYENTGDMLAPQVVKISQLLDLLIVDFMRRK